jgi:hypothetical protein
VGQSSSQHDKCQVGNMHTYSLELVHFGGAFIHSCDHSVIHSRIYGSFTHSGSCHAYLPITVPIGVQACTLKFGTEIFFGVHTQYGYMLSRDNLVNGVCGVMVHGVGVLNIGMVQCVEKNVCEILAHDTKIARDRY